MWQRTQHDAVAVLTYRREPDNALGFVDLGELDSLLLCVAKDEATRVIVLTGGLPGFFVAHADLADVEQLVRGDSGGPHGPDAWGTALQRISDVPQPVVAAVNGQAWGGGFELALACMMRVAAQSAQLRFVEVAHGAIPGAGGTQRLPRLVGPSQAARLVLSGELLTAEQAAALGVVDAVLPDEDFLAHVLTWLAPIAAAPRHSLVAAKRALVEGALLPLPQGLDLEQRLFRDVLRSPETRALHRRD
ncbi:enoyl-CoA hydratase [Acidothermaceae bacterium B102]|nr:enoyl-CoA hydratase [Acidothermaceae bacterium B102]